MVTCEAAQDGTVQMAMKSVPASIKVPGPALVDCTPVQYALSVQSSPPSPLEHLKRPPVSEVD
jgi:hypothetical protein